MSAARHARVREIFLTAYGRPPAKRGAFLTEACADDPELRAEVESLLARCDSAGGFLEEPLLGPAFRLSAPPESGSPAPPPPKRVGPYSILGVLGEGGMGVVYLAEQANPRRAVALKVVRPGLVSQRALRRFDQEAQALGKLDHPGIARIYEAGTAGEGASAQPYFAMELVRGLPLVEHANERNLRTRERLELFLKVCEAVRHAHGHGVVHRDLKPANILVDESGEPRVLDFGVARVTDGAGDRATLETSDGQLLGTLPYMSPEQASGDPLGVDARADLYSLGVVAFELLAGRLPYDVAGLPLAEAARTIREAEPPGLGTIDRGLRGDVATIVAKCLAKERERRYASVAEVAEDIRRHLRHEPILARPPSLLYRLRKLARRRPSLAGSAAVLLAAVGAVVPVLVSGAADRRKEGEAALRQAARFLLRGEPRSAIERLDRARSLGLEEPDLRASAELALRKEEVDRELDDARLVLFLSEPGRKELERADALAARAAAFYGGREAFHPIVLRALLAFRRRDASAAARFCLEAARSREIPVPADLAVKVGAVVLRMLAESPDPDVVRVVHAPDFLRGPEADALLERLLAYARGEAADVPEVSVVVAVLLGLLERDRESIQLLEDVLEREPKNVWVLELKALRLLASDEAQAALEAAKSAVVLSGGRARSHFVLGCAHLDAGSPEKALEAFTRSIESSPGLSELWTWRARSLCRLGRDEEALADFARALEISPELGYVRVDRGWALYRLGRHEEALLDFEAAVGKRDARAGRADQGRAAVFLKLRRFEECRRAAEQALAQDPSLAWALVLKADAEEALGDLEGAARDARLALRLARRARWVEEGAFQQYVDWAREKGAALPASARIGDGSRPSAGEDHPLLRFDEEDIGERLDAAAARLEQGDVEGAEALLGRIPEEARLFAAQPPDLLSRAGVRRSVKDALGLAILRLPEDPRFGPLRQREGFPSLLAQWRRARAEVP